MGPSTSRPRRTVVACAVAFAAVAWWAPSASAQRTPAPAEAEETDAQREARARFTLARVYYDAGRFREAAAEFERAYELTGRAELLYNVHLAYRDAGDVERAADALRRYLASDAEIDPALRRTLVNRMTALDAAIAERAARDREPAPSGPSGGTPGVPTATPSGDAAGITASDSTGGTAAVEGDPDATAGTSEVPASTDLEAGASDTPSNAGRRGRRLGLAFLVSGGAVLGGAGIASAIALRTRNERDAACRAGASGTDCPPDYDQDAAVTRFTRSRNLGYAQLGLGAPLAVVGVVMIVVRDADAPEVTLWVDVDPVGRSIGVAGRF